MTYVMLISVRPLFQACQTKTLHENSLSTSGKIIYILTKFLFTPLDLGKILIIPLSECLISIGNIDKPSLIPEIVFINFPIHGWDTFQKKKLLSLNSPVTLSNWSNLRLQVQSSLRQPQVSEHS